MDAANEVVANATPEEVEVLAGNGTPAQVSAARNHAAKRALRAVGKYLPDGALPVGTAAGGYLAGLATAPALRRASEWGAKSWDWYKKRGTRTEPTRNPTVPRG